MNRVLLILSLFFLVCCTGKTPSRDAIPFLFDNDGIVPEVCLRVDEQEWNRLLEAFDQDHKTRESVHADMTFIKGSDSVSVQDIALSIKGNTSRRRPEGSTGEKHRRDSADWHHCHFGLTLDKYHPENGIGSMKRLVLKWFKDDRNYVREMYCYDLFRRSGVWTGPEDVYVRVRVQVGDDPAPAYFGVYQMYEPYDRPYLERRKERFGHSDGNLWACSFGATLTPPTLGRIGEEDQKGLLYELVSSGSGIDGARAQMTAFVRRLNTLEGQEFHDWIGSVMDIDLFLKTYAVNVGVGMWDDHWNNRGNNTYLYFSSLDSLEYKVYLLPHDYDNTLGTCHRVGVQTDAVLQDPFHWGPDDPAVSPLLPKILAFDDYRAIYARHLRELVQEGGLLTYESSIARIRSWQDLIRKYIPNDTGEDMELVDIPAYWGNHPEYRVLEDGGQNFFRAKVTAMRQALEAHGY